jgi:hypothetical protein
MVVPIEEGHLANEGRVSAYAEKDVLDMDHGYRTEAEDGHFRLQKSSAVIERAKTSVLRAKQDVEKRNYQDQAPQERGTADNQRSCGIQECSTLYADSNLVTETLASLWNGDGTEEEGVYSFVSPGSFGFFGEQNESPMNFEGFTIHNTVSEWPDISQRENKTGSDQTPLSGGSPLFPPGSFGISSEWGSIVQTNRSLEEYTSE